MADDMFEADEDVVGAEEAQPSQKRVGFLPGVVIQILKWVGIILGAVIFIVTVVVVTVNFLGRGTNSQTFMPQSEDYQAEVPILTWFEQVGELRGSTADEQRTTYIVTPLLGYDGENNALVNELILREIQLVGIFNDYFSSRSVAELERNQDAVEVDLLERINRILRDGRVVDIVWRSYQFLPF